MNHDLFTSSLAGVFGLLIGSFLNVCIVRWPAEQSVVRPRSRCPRCGNLIAWYDNIPIISWLVLRAKCRHCSLPIPVFYPAVELAIGLIWAFCVWRFGLELEALRGAVFLTILFGIAMTDAREYIIPDEFSIGGAVLGVLFAVAGLFVRENNLHPEIVSWLQSLMGAAVGFGLLWLVAVVGSKLFGEDAMGGGDVKMMAMIGAFLGWPGVLWTIFLGSVGGVIIFLPLKLAGKEKLVPFGIFLAIGAAACWILGTHAMNDWYVRTFLVS